MLTTLEMTPVRRKGYFDFSESPVAAGAVEKWESRGVCRISKGGALLAGIWLRLRGRTAVSPRTT